MRDALQRFATGTYAVWYPQLAAARSGSAAGTAAATRRRRLARRRAQRHGAGQPTASVFSVAAMFVFNPPWKLEARLGEAMPMLVEALGQDAAAAFKLEFRQS